MPSHPRCLAASLVAVLAGAAACTAGPADPPDATGRQPASTSPAAPTGAATPHPATSRTPLVVAVHPTRRPPDLSVAQVRALRAGDVTDWAELGAPAAPLRTGTAAMVRADRNTSR